MQRVVYKILEEAFSKGDLEESTELLFFDKAVRDEALKLIYTTEKARPELTEEVEEVPNYSEIEFAFRAGKWLYEYSTLDDEEFSIITGIDKQGNYLYK